MKNKILVVEDNEMIIKGLKYTLEQENFDCEFAKNAMETEDKIYNNKYDLVILDVSLPDGNGFEICKNIKSDFKDLPIIFLTAKNDENDIVSGFNLGAEDYITKPFKNRVLISRINNVLRRYNKDQKEIISGDIKIDLVNDRVYKIKFNNNLLMDGEYIDKSLTETKENKNAEKNTRTNNEKQNEEEIVLTPLEFKILAYLFQNKGKNVPREKILEQIWDLAGNIVNDNTLTVYIKRIREKTNEDDLIKTVKGIGYRVE